MNKINSGGDRISDPHMDPGTNHEPDRDTGKTCLGGGMHYHSAPVYVFIENSLKWRQ